MIEPYGVFFRVTVTMIPHVFFVLLQSSEHLVHLLDVFIWLHLLRLWCKRHWLCECRLSLLWVVHAHRHRHRKLLVIVDFFLAWVVQLRLGLNDLIPMIPHVEHRSHMDVRLRRLYYSYLFLIIRYQLLHSLGIRYPNRDYWLLELNFFFDKRLWDFRHLGRFSHHGCNLTFWLS